MTNKTYLFLLFLSIGVHCHAQSTKAALHSAPYHHQNIIFTCQNNQYELDELSNIINSTWHNRKPKNSYNNCNFHRNVTSIYISARSKGSLIKDGWGDTPRDIAWLVKFIDFFIAGIDSEKRASIDAVELHINHNINTINYANHQERMELMSNIHRGIKGIELSYNGNIERYSATYSISRNRKHQKIINRFLDKHKIKELDFQKYAVTKWFNADQYIFLLGDKPTAHKMFRGNKIIDIRQVDQTSTKQWAKLAGDWLINNIHPNGRMTYKYFPSRGQESKGNNMIRQWMASSGLNHIAMRSKDPELWKKIERNIDYNLRNFYHEENTFGLIEYNGKVKLGAMALATIAIIEHPQRNKWRKHELALRRTIQSLWKEDGSFKTFYKPINRNDNQNFYPGEALLLWGMLIDEAKGLTKLLNQYMKSFYYYRDWHFKNRNPAFIPWHTRGHYLVWKINKNDELKQFIFEMNDWLIDTMQQWEGNALYEDTYGRFYTKNHNYGPPHASATGVYLESLIDAYRLAKSVKDDKRMEKYRIAMLRGTRSQMQLQFTDAIDMFYISEKNWPFVKGGLRTTVYDNQVRCDNIQHGLMGILEIIDEFSPQDYLIH